MATYQVKLVEKSSQATKVVELDKGKTVINTPSKHNILVLEKATGKSAKTLQMKRKGKDLLIELDNETSIEFVDYYLSENVTFLGELDGGLSTYNLPNLHSVDELPTLTNAVSNSPSSVSVASKPVVASSGSSIGVGKVLAGVGLALGGIAGLASAASKSNDSKDASSTGSNSNNLPPQNSKPTAIQLSQSAVNENAQGVVIAKLTTADADKNDTHTYTVNDSRFEVVNGELKLKHGVSLDYETATSIPVEVTSTDKAGASTKQVFNITVNNVNDAPTAITLAGSKAVNENTPGTVIGKLTTTDADKNDTHTYTVNDSRFEVVNGELKLKHGVSLDYETATSILVEVTSTDKAGASTKQVFNIAVNNVNDAPTAITLAGSKAVNENTPGTVIGKLTTTDADKNDTHTYTVNDSRFEVVNGELKLKNGISLDYETATSIPVEVTSTDKAGASTKQTFTITVNDVVENQAPTAIKLSEQKSVNENDSSGVLIGTLSTTDSDVNDTHTYTVNDTRFEIVNGNQLKLKAQHSLDFEDKTTVVVEVTSTDKAGASTKQAFNIAVNNINEAPTAITLSGSKAVNENTPGVVIGKLTTTDADKNDTHTYTVSDSRFEVVNGELKLKNGISLDYETATSIPVEVTSTDKAGTSTKQVFNIGVNNVNEEPTAITLTGSKAVNENTPSAVIGKLSTTDVDKNDTHTYTVDDGRFEVVDGELKLQHGVSLDYETATSIPVKVTSTDKAGASTQQAFTITVNNVNEAPTVIALQNPQAVDEEVYGVVVGKLMTTDPDGSGDTHTYHIADANSPFELDSANQLKLKNTERFDFETQPTVTVNITSTDKGGLSITQPISIQVKNTDEKPQLSLIAQAVDENAKGEIIGRLSTLDVDNSKIQSYEVSDSRFEVVNHQLKLKDSVQLDFESTPNIAITVSSIDHLGIKKSQTFSIQVNNVNEAPTAITLAGEKSVNENSARAVIGKLTTTDVDAGDTFTYRVNDNRFEVVNGELKLKVGQSLNYEDNPTVRLEITSTDAGGESITRPFEIQVNNVNEAPTAIQLDKLTVNENSVGAAIGKLTTTDVDAGDTFTYSVNDSRFEVVNGQLKLKTGVALDYEAVKSIPIEITSTDKAGASTKQRFTITVNNVNEAPTAIQLDQLTVNENLVGTVIGKLTTTDVDAGDTFTYSVNDSRFEVVNGQLKLKAGVALDYETVKSIPIEITSTDKAGASAKQTFTIAVNNVNEAPTAIQLDKLAVNENSVGAAIGKLTTTDVDAGDTFTYSVNDSRFEVVNGQLKLKAGVALDYETVKSIPIEITSTDKAGASTKQTFTIMVNNVNEAPTAIQLDQLTVNENAVSTVIGKLTTTDADANDTHTYRVNDSRFEVVNGQLKLKAGVALDYEIVKSIPIEITSTDKAGASTKQTFTIMVNNVNEAPTAIQLDKLTVNENSVGAAIGKLTTTDVDANDTHTYRVNDSRFEVVNGQLKLKAGVALDYEAVKSIPIEITSTDKAGASAKQTFTITVNNVNEAPTAIQLDKLTVNENLVGTAIGKLTTTDVDAGDTFTYSVNDSRFEVLNGELKLKQGVSLDYEAVKSIPIEITSRDQAGASIQQAFTITVNNVNEQPTDIRLDKTSANEEVYGIVVGNLTTTDPDGDSNTHTYLIADTNSPFEIVNGNQLKLKATERFDFETQPTVSVNVTSTDQEGLSVKKALQIQVNNMPEVPQLSLTANTVNENAPEEVIGRLSTLDVDNSNIQSYEVSDHRFEVVNHQLKLKDGVQLDFETTRNIDVVVSSIDHLGVKKSHSFSIVVQNVNEQPTLITLDGTSVDEHTQGAVIGSLHTTDIDEGDEFTYTVNDTRFEIVNGKLKLKNGVELNYEERASLPVEITSTDKGGLSTKKTFTIQVNNVNEAPTAITLAGSKSVTENVVAATIGTLTTTDPDAGDTFTYRVNDNRFEVVNGELKLKAGQSLNYEDSPTVRLEITSTDAGGEFITRPFEIKVNNANEAPTNIHLDKTSVKENAQDVVIGNLTTNDPDKNDTFTYTITDRNSPFEIVGNQLKLKTGQSFNFEMTQSAVVNIRSTDADGAFFDKAFTINVENVNEAPTEITLSGSKAVDENEQGAIIGTLSVKDPDVEDKDKHTYTIVEEGKGVTDRFVVENGMLKLKQGVSLNYDTERSVKLYITASDTAQQTVMNSFDIQVNNVQHRPTSIQLLNPKAVNEKEPIGAVIGELSTVDLDDTQHTYTLQDKRFEVVNNQLKLKEGVVLYHDKEQVITVNITSTDKDGLSTSEQFNVQVNQAPRRVYFNREDGQPNRDDTLTSTKRNDILAGDTGNDTYVFRKGDGHDRIQDWLDDETKYNTIKFVDVNLSDISHISRPVGGSTELTIHYGKDSLILVENQNQHDKSKVQFADGTSLTITELMAKVPTYMIGTSGNDIFAQYNEKGKDTYFFTTGDGQDTVIDMSKDNKLVFTNIDSTEITLSHSRDVVTIHYGNGDKVSFKPNVIKEIQFNDISWAGTDLTEKLRLPYWTESLLYDSGLSGMYMDENGDQTVYYAFPTRNLMGRLEEGWSAFTAEQKRVAEQAFRKLEEFLPIKFVEKTGTVTQLERDVIYLQNTKLPSSMAGFGGSNSDGVGGVWMASSVVDDDTLHVMAHEIGHALGLNHPQHYHTEDEEEHEHEDKRHSLTDVEDKGTWTIMSYDHANRLPDYQEFDIAALQYLYGVNPNVRTGDDQYFFNSSVGQFVWDGAGSDTINASSATENVYINLNAGTHSYVGQKSDFITAGNQLTINHGTVIEKAVGGRGNDTLIGNTANNVLTGGAGNDTLTGGKGLDVFNFSPLTNDATGGHGHDTITDFHVGNLSQDTQADILNLLGLLVGHHGDKSVTGLENYLSVSQQNGNTVVSIDRDGSGTAFAQADLVTLEKVQTTLAELLANQQIII